MRKRAKAPLSPEKVAEKAKKNWRAVNLPLRDKSIGAAPDAVAPELDALKKRYGGTSSIPKPRVKKNSSKMTIVVMEPKVATDSHIGRKAVVVKDDKIIGEQG